MECMEREDRSHENGGQVRPPRPPPPVVSTDVNSYKYLQRMHDKAFHFSSQGLSAEETGNSEIALTSYKEAIELMTKVLEMDSENLTNATSDEKDKAKLLQQKVTKTKMQIEYRIQELERELAPQASQDYLMQVDSPPSYDEAMSSGSAWTSLGDSIMSDEQRNTDVMANAEQLFTIEEGVQMFFITPEGYVSAPSYPARMRLCRFSDDGLQSAGATNAPSPPAFLQIGDWVYPLIPGMSPALQTSYGGYIFPDTLSQIPGASVGLMLPETVSDDERQTFEQLLSSLTVMREQVNTIQPADITLPSAPIEQHYPPQVVPQIPPPQPTAVEERESTAGQKVDTSTKISKGISVAADWITWGLGKGAEKTGDLIKFGSQRLQQRINPVSNPKPIPPRVQTGVTYARKASHAAVTVSSFLVTKLGDATVKLGRHLAPHVKKQGARFLPKSLSQEGSDGKSKMSGVIEVAASGIKGFGTVYMGLESAAKALAKSLANETVVVVQHRYGREAGAVTDNTLYSIGNLGMTAFNVDNLGVKAMAKRAAKETGKAVIKDYADEHSRRAQQNQNGPLQYPNPASNSTTDNSNCYPKLPENKQ
ncbi:spartin isoform X1 [Patella vulgata]|uniref:spartin isoform X1 n=2 Tax=Patella vulgata TaxID=6465 RepID=UPI0024A8A8E1|nr:spartin isoform X1 [Patella vulgata]